MTGRRLIILIFLALLAPLPALAQSTQLLAVMPLRRAEGVEKSISAWISDQLREELAADGQYSVLLRDEMFAALKDTGNNPYTCVETECIVKMGKDLFADKIVFGRVSKKDSKCAVSAILLDVGSASVDATAGGSSRCSKGEIKSMLVKLAGELLPGDDSGAASNDKSEQQYGQLSILSTPEGASIYLNGDFKGVTPANLEMVEPGSYELWLVKGTDEIKRPIEIAAGSNDEVNIVLGAQKGELLIKTKPGGAEVFLGAAMIGKTPGKFEVDAGDYKLVLKRDLFKDHAEDITIDPAKPTKLAIKLKPNFGKLAVKTKPAGADAYIDGNKLKKQTPLVTNLGVGSYTLQIKKSGYLDLSRTIKIENKKVAKVAVKLKAGDSSEEEGDDEMSEPSSETDDGEDAEEDEDDSAYVASSGGGGGGMSATHAAWIAVSAVVAAAGAGVGVYGTLESAGAEDDLAKAREDFQDASTDEDADPALAAIDKANQRGLVGVILQSTGYGLLGIGVASAIWGGISSLLDEGDSSAAAMYQPDIRITDRSASIGLRVQF